ncbi:DUF4944 domain-containing protein [Bacillus swezeyi]|uniref:DUF4944 domain-containing protein n=1 Tax=Bacillus swezeyi TaxID=1925020 RepID=UPI0027DDF51A|nr:DUF4944 domain-containing protein [Bacillus swezeyi]
MIDYAGGAFPGGGSKEESVSFLEKFGEVEFDGHCPVELETRKACVHLRLIKKHD